MRNVRIVRNVSVMIVICMIFLSFAGLASAKSKPETTKLENLDNHWAKTELKSWIERGWLKGFPDGSIKPDQKVTRAEFIALVNNAFGFSEQAEIGYTDLKSTDWSYAQFAKAIKAGYISGFADGTMRPGRLITREEAATIAGKLLGLNGDEGAPRLGFKDVDSIAGWSLKSVQAVVFRNIMRGTTGNLFEPGRALTRAEAVALLNRAVQERTGVYHTAGIYGPSSGTVTLSGKRTITSADVTLQNAVITGNLTFGSAIGDGDSTVNKITVKGTTVINGGGVNSIHINDSTLKGLVIDRLEGPVRVAMNRSTHTGIYVKSSAILEATGNITLSDELPAGSEVTLSGDLGDIDVRANDITLILSAGSANRITIATGATGVKLKLQADTHTTLMVINEAVTVTGKGTIEEAVQKAVGSTFETKPKSGTATQGGGNTVTPAPAVQVVENGQGRAVIVIANDADEQTSDAAEVLQHYIEKSTGVQLPVQSSNANIPANVIPIYVGTHLSSDQATIDGLLANLSADGFVIVPNADRITIQGVTAWGTEFGVYEFLERYVGVRWLLPGPDGEDVPSSDKITVPLLTVQQQPAFFSRSYDSTVENTVQRSAWTRFNRIHKVVDHNHNLYNLFSPAKYLATHPEYFPAGKDLTQLGAWQPCFSEPGTVTEAISTINQYFDDHPEATSYSVAVNDNGGFCEENPNHPNYPNKLNSIGLQDMSDLYFNWVNEVAAGVFAEHPDKYLGTVAYAEVFDPPTTVTLHPHVIVYITDERMSWGDPALAVAGKSLTERWKLAAPGLAFYEYLYGSIYTVPRTYLHRMADVYKYAYDAGVVAQFAELYPNFGEGPKPWLSAKLQWDANANVDQLLNDWYVRAVGEEAAPYLAQYYSIWEDFWQVKIFESSWYQSWLQSNPRRNFMPLTDATYLKAVSLDDVEESRQLMEAVVAKAHTPQQQKRAEILMRAFEYYEASVLSYPDNKPYEPIESAAEGVAALNKMITKLEKAEQRLKMVDDFAGDEILQHPFTPAEGGMAWSGVNSNEVMALVEWMKDEPANGEVRSLAEQLAENEVSDYARNYVKLVLALVNNAETLTENASLETGLNGQVMDDAPPWWYWLEFGQDENNMHRTVDIAFTGSHSLETIGVKLGGPVQEVEIQPGYHGMSVYYYTPAGTNTNGKILIGMNLLDANNQWLGSMGTETKAVGDNAGRWSITEWVGQIPEQIHGVPVRKAQIIVQIRDFAGTEKLYVDDINFFRLDGPYTSEPEEASELNYNTSFEIGSSGVDDAQPWSYWVNGGMTATRTMKRSTDFSKSGDYSLKMSEIGFGSVVQNLSNHVLLQQPGRYKLQAYYYVPAGTSTNGTISIGINLKDQNHVYLDGVTSATINAGADVGSWHLIEWEGEIPEEINGTPVEVLQIGVLVNDFAAGESIYLDDIRLTKTDELPAEPQVVGVTASNGSAVAVLSEGLSTTPDIADFTIERMIDEGAAVEVTPLGLSWNAATQTASFTLPLVQEATAEQSVIYRIAYKNTSPVSSEPFIVSAVIPVLNDNDSFESGSAGVDDAQPWSYWVDGGMTATKSMSRSDAFAKSGEYSLKMSEIGLGSVVQNLSNPVLPQQPGTYKLQAYYYVPAGTSTNGTISIGINLKDQNHVYLDGVTSATINAGADVGSWHLIEWEGEIPEEINGTPVEVLQIGVLVQSFGAGETIYLDDVRLMKVD